MSNTQTANVSVRVAAAGNTQLTYALQTNPAPLTVSVPGQSPEIASLQFVVTNPTNESISVASIIFTLEMGTSGSSISPTTQGILTQVSDTVDWKITGPGTVTSGPAPYVLGPAVGSSVTLAAGGSVVVVIYRVQTVETPGTSTIEIKEMLQGIAPTFANFAVTTFPDGFYFNGLVATVPQGSELVPVAEIDNNGTANVTLVWNSSVTETSAFTILYSNASLGQQTAKPIEIGQWVSPPLTTDTVFTVSVLVSMIGGQPLIAALSTTVAVQNPALIAASITAGTAKVTGNAGVDGLLTAGAVTVTGNATVDQLLTAASAVIAGSSGLTVNANGSVQMSTFNAAGGVIESNDTWQTAFVVQNDSVGKSFQFLVGGSGNNTSAAGVGGLGIYDSAFEGFRFNITANGNVGIGTTNPIGKLHVKGDYGDTGSGGITLDASDAGAPYYMQLNPYVVTGGSVGYGFQTYSPNAGSRSVMAVTDQGNIGIGTQRPAAPLHVAPALSVVPWSLQDQYTVLGYQWNSHSSNNVTLGLTGRGQTSLANVSILAEGNIAAPQIFAYSDERIKDIEGRSDGVADLATLLGIEVTDYRYKDLIGMGTSLGKKAIAQQVESVYPQAVATLTGIVPDVYQTASYCGEGWIVIPHDLKQGERVRLIADKADGVYEVLEAEEFRFRTDFTTTSDSVFVFGREVDDFRTVDYDAISMLNVSATQQLKKEKDDEIKTLRDLCANLIDRVAELERRMATGVDLSAAAAAGHPF